MRLPIVSRTLEGPWAARMALGLILSAVAAAYSGAPANQFVLDDEHTVVRNPSITSSARVGGWFWSPYATSGTREYVNYRPVLIASYALDYRLWGLSPAGFHATNVAIHAGAVVFVFLLGRRLTPDPWTAVGAAGVFALHPINAEAVNYISARSSSLMTLLILAALWADARAVSGGPRRWRVVRYLLGAAAMGTKEAAVVLPALVIVWRRMENPGRESWSASVRRSAPWWILTACYLAIRVWVLSGVIGRGGAGTDATDWQDALFASKIYAASLGHWLWPSALAVDHGWPPWIGVPEAGSILVALAVALAMTIALGLKKAGIGMCVAWFWVALLPVGALGFVSRVALYQDHRVYLAGVGLAWLVGRGGAAVFRRAAAGPALRRGAAAAVVFGAVGFAINADVARTTAWTDRGSLWDDVLIKYPVSAMAHNGKGAMAFEAGRVNEARDWFERTVNLAPGFSTGHKNLGVTFARLKDWDRAVAALQRALSLAPGDTEARVNLGKVYERMGRPERAFDEYGRVVRDDPGYVSVWARMGWILAQGGRFTDAVGHFERGGAVGALDDDALMAYGAALLALERWGDAERLFATAVARNPNSPHARFNRAAALDGGGAWDRAVEEYRRAATLGPDDPDSFVRIGVLLAKQERWQEADAAYREALLRDPNYVPAHANAGLVAERLGDRDGAIAHYDAVLRTRPSGPGEDALRAGLGDAVARLRAPEGTKPIGSRSSKEGTGDGGG